ncbi:MAG: VWA domain-containing protein [Saprospiraceae bacterium]|nr:VWA domain-containing protein [Bacteroidota bacterium]
MNDDFNIGEIVTPPAFQQLGIFVIDGSGSMTGKTSGSLSKAEAVNLAVKETLTRFKVSRKKDCFSFSVVAFGDHAKMVTPRQKGMDIDDYADYNPLQFFDNGTGSSSTNIASGLDEALKIANEFFANKESSVPHKVAIVVLTDGMCHHEADTKRVADQIKQNPNVQIFCCCLEELGQSYTEAETLLKYVATNPTEGYRSVYDKDTIRGFFVNSITAASGMAKIE